ncbi:hypothetical protein [Rhodanobacter sp. MP7CTX1]|jgi:hypothetical protein|uniref:hypothetical protein n=1 Tax=Rhodanobacter sp. MP7CTX1 TaxID=2723084 RepID=UPI00161A9754|nr:hypothetical protein [Rhodanobacter sp. MP7CTX1]MBB6187822.1 hypothetical protein [Rhodanobacter sp. MP7CTX1]
MSIVLHIERLVLDEALLGGELAGTVRSGLERELTLLLAQPDSIDMLRRLGAVDTLPPASLPSASRRQGRLGPRIAAAVKHGLSTPATTIARRQDMQRGGHD